MLKQSLFRLIVATIAGLVLLISQALRAQDAQFVIGNVNSADTVKGVLIHSTTNGVKFPDNTVQTSAAGIVRSTGTAIINNLGGGNSAVAPLSLIASGKNDSIYGNADYAIILGGKNNVIENQITGYSSSSPSPANPGSHNFISGGEFNRIKPNANHSSIIGGANNIIASGAANSVILGGSNITATEPNTVYVQNLNTAGNFSVTGTFKTTRIISPDSAIHFGDSSIIFLQNQNIIYASPYGKYKGLGVGNYAYAYGNKSLALGDNVNTGAQGAFSIVLGSGYGAGQFGINDHAALVNNIPNSLMIGFNSAWPTLFVGPASAGKRTGNVGIGTTTPKAKLEVTGGGTKDEIVGSFNQAGATYSKQIFMVPYLNTGGYNSVSIAGDAGIFWSDGLQGGGKNSSSALVIGPWHDNGPTVGIRIDANGNVGIGTTLVNNPNNYKFAVAGIIGAKEEVMVENISTTWPDYVFESSENHMNYVEKEVFFKKNKHLPGIDPAEEIQKNGLRFVKTLAGITQNVEENSLDIIELSKQNAELKKELENLKRQMEEFKKK